MTDSVAESQTPSTEELRAELERLREERAALQAKLAKRKPARRRFPWRGLVSWILVVLACLTSILAPIAVWAKSSFLDTENFVATVGPLVSDETVARALSAEVSSRLFLGLNIRERTEDAIKETLPASLGFLGGPIASGLQALTDRITYEVVTSSQFEAVWKKILELAHSTAAGIIRGDRSITLSSKGEVVLDVSELVTNVRDRLVRAGLGFLEKIPLPASAREVVLFRSSQLGMVKTSVDILDTLNWALPLLALILFAAAVLVSEDRRRALLISSVALAVAMSLSLMAIDLAKGELLGQLKKPVNLDAATIVWDRITSDLVRANAGVLALGIVGALGFAVSGPYAWAVWVRRKVGHLFALQREYRLKGRESGPVGVFFAAHIWGIRVGGAAAFFGILWLMRPLRVAEVIVMTGIYLIYLVVCELLRGKLPEPPGGGTEEGAREESREEEGEGGSEASDAARRAEEENA